VEYAPPTLITPDNEKKFTAKELQGVVMFRWTPLVPKPKEPVTYRLKVWQLMQGQNGTQAMRTNQPIVTKDVDNITQAAINSIITGPCKPPYLCDFIWNVQALNRNGKPMGNNNGTSEPYTFSAAEEKTKGPENVFPENEKKFNPADVKQAVTFRWTPIAPKLQEPVTYRLKVWQLMQGQSGSQAMRTNQPIVTKDADNITEATVSGIYTGPCRPPYLCDYIWIVEASSQQAGAAPKIIGTSEPTTFSVAGETDKCPAGLFPEDKKQFTSEEAKKEMLFRWTPVVPKPQEPVTYRMKVWQLMQGQSGSQAMRTNQPIVTKDVDNITEATVSGIYTGPCRPPYLCDFIWIVEAVSKDGRTGCVGESTTFSVTEENSKGPNNTFPEDKSKLKPEEAKQSVTFRWTPIVPKPQEPVTYRLKVWQLMQGQNGTTAMKGNKPVVEKEYQDILIDMKDQTMKAVISNLYTGPCRPPYLCDFIWNVEAITKDGRTKGSSEPTTFKIAGNDIDIQIDSVYVSCCNTNGTQNVYIKIKNNLANTVKITQLNIDKVNGVTNVISITGLAPVLPVNITGLGTQAFTGTIKCIDTAKTIRFFVRAEDALDNAITETEVETDTLDCPCNPCRYMDITVQKDSLTLPKNGNPMQVNLIGSFVGLNPNLIKKVTAEIIYFSITQTKDTNCAKCVFDSKYYGNFFPPASALSGYTGPVFNKPDYSRLVTWNSTIIKDCGGQPHDNGGGVDNGNPADIKTMNVDRQTPKLDFGDKMAVPVIGNPPPPLPLPNFILPIAVPEMNSLSCCGDVIKICIRYTFYDFCCHACEVIKCYEIKREK
jgi:hypothetical protein